MHLVFEHILKLEINDKGVFINDKEIQGTEDRQYSYDFENVEIEKPNTPDTGDTRNIVLWSVLLGISIIGIAGITVDEIIKRKRQK